jgi:hypothetical protein
MLALRLLAVACPQIKSPLLCSRVPRHYLRLYVRTSEDVPLP